MEQCYIREAASRHQSFYLYDEASILKNVCALRSAFPSVEFLYSLKCNPNHRCVRAILGQGFGADAASAAEVALARQCGAKKENIFYSAPGKTRADIRSAFGQAILIADSLSEIRKIQDLAHEENKPVEIGIRINPDFTFTGTQGVPSKFGIDEKTALNWLKAADPAPVTVTGIHVHIKSQELSAENILRYYRSVFTLAERVEQALGRPLAYINFGSGIGIPYADCDPSVDIQWLGKQMEQQIHRYRQTHPETRLLIEVGRYAVGKSGIYVTHVADRKVSCGKTYVILQNTLNGFLRPSLARLVEKYANGSPAVGTEPLFTDVNAFDFHAITDSTELETVTLVGNLCTAADVIAEDILLPKLQEGDLVVISNAGSYAFVLSPMQFSSQAQPAEVVLTTDGQLLCD